MNDVLIFVTLYTLLTIVLWRILNPTDAWKDGYEAARKLYGDWEQGFDDGWTLASRQFQDYEQGFGDGFETGWNAALEQKEIEDAKEEVMR